MSAVLSAFVQYIITFILLVAAAAGGIFCGKKLRTKKNMESNTAGEMGRVVWPLMPLLSVLWFLTADLMAREARGLDTLGSLGLVIGVLALMAAVAVQALYFGGLPEWAYPGWMARRYYASHPGARERELGTRAAI